MTPAEIEAVHSVWWRLRRHHGVRLPAEADLIVLTGGAT